MLPPHHPDAPKYWMYETGGELGRAVRRYLEQTPEHHGDIALLRAYLRQWIMSPVWREDTDGILTMLRQRIDFLHTREDVDRWIMLALDVNIDPL